MRLSNKAKYLLQELLRYQNKYRVNTFGIFIVSEYTYDLVFHYKEETLTYRFVGLTNDELRSALRELNERYLYYSVNMHYLVTLMDSK